MPEPIPALTLWQPWATLIQIGVKPFETRGWATAYRGPLAIHAGITLAGMDACQDELAITQPLRAAGFRRWRDLPRGQIVAVAELIECWPTEAILEDDLADPFGDYSPGRFAWHLHRVRPLPAPIRCVGRQRLWTPPPSVQFALRQWPRGPQL